MKDLINLWNRLVGTTYEAVNSNNHTVQSKYDNSSVYNLATTCPVESSCESKPEHRKRALIYVVLALASILTGVSIIVVKPYEALYRYKSVFGDGGEVFELWRKPPIDLYLRVFLWNVTNKEDYMSGKDDKLKIEEVGPYVYKELMSHENVTFNNNGTFTAIPKHPLVWVPELSEGRREDDLLILPNIALLSIAQVVSDQSYFTRIGLNLLIRQTQSEALVQMTAREFMFGYKSTLMTLGNKFLSSWIYFDKLGLIDRMYDFEGDFETVFTGEDDIKKAGQLDTFHGSTKIPQWDDPCGNIQNASDGTKFPPFIQPEDKLFFYRKSMCRSKYLIKKGEKKTQGLNAYVYEFEDGSDDNGKYNKSNECFCKDLDNCLPPGLLDVHGCYYGFPVTLSNPHFLHYESLGEKVVGSQPDPKKHTSYFVIEPQSGTPLELSASFQINMALKDISLIANSERFANMVLPLLWAEFRLYTLPDFLKAKLQIYINVLPVLEKVILYGSFISGAFLVFFSIYKFKKAKHSTEGMSPWLHADLHVIERKLSSYIPEQQINSKEMEIYYNSLVTPLNKDLTTQELREIKAEK